MCTAQSDCRWQVLVVAKLINLDFSVRLFLRFRELKVAPARNNDHVGLNSRDKP